MPVSSPRVLIADDSDDVRRMLCAALRACAEVVGAVANGREALAAASRLQPDVILMDYRMPLMDGLAAAAAIKRGPDAPRIVLFTSEDPRALHSAALATGVDAVLQKGCSLVAIRDAVQAAAPVGARRAA